jgi:S1-C subfamily serine protease
LRGRTALVAALLVWSAASTPFAATIPVERSVVRIVCNAQHPDWYTPWSAGTMTRHMGSGFVIDGGRILTTAHLVSDARFVALFLYGDPNPHEGRIVVEGHDCDLALIRPVEEHLLDGVPALALGDLPPLRSTVETYGYSSGSDQISSTRGVVSRIDRQLYIHSGADGHLAVQTDAAINPGGSGGPVVQDGKIVGVAFQNNRELQSVGFFIPTEVIRHFLLDASDGTYDGYPDLAVRTSTLENPAARRSAGMREGESGVRVDWISPGGSADGPIRVGDVLLGIDKEPIADDGTVASGELRLPFGLLVDRHQIGETVTLGILREGERKEVTIALRGFPALVRWSNQYDRRPRYYVYAGLVFVPLDLEMLKTYGDTWSADADSDLLYELLFRHQEEPRILLKERIVLLRRLDHPVNVNMWTTKNTLVERVNGRSIDSLEGLIRAIEENKNPYHTFEFAYFGRMDALDREAADRANPQILHDYAVPRDRNP